MLQVVIVPIVKNEANKERILEACERLHTALKGADVRVKLDDRLDRSPGFKFNDYEMRVGQPMRLQRWAVCCQVPHLMQLTRPCGASFCCWDLVHPLMAAGMMLDVHDQEAMLSLSFVCCCVIAPMLCPWGMRPAFCQAPEKGSDRRGLQP